MKSSTDDEHDEKIHGMKNPIDDEHEKKNPYNHIKERRAERKENRSHIYRKEKSMRHN